MKLFRNRFRIASSRLPSYDYSSAGAYFITICTKNRLHYFGDVVNNSMVLNIAGEIATKIWFEIPQHFPFVDLGNFIAMPNHTHGVIIINKSKLAIAGNNLIIKPTEHRRSNIVQLKNNGIVQLSPPGGITKNNNPMLRQNISRIIRWYKGRTTFEIRKVLSYFSWQPRFHDSIIRNQDHFNAVQRYILNNPKEWMIR